MALGTLGTSATTSLQALNAWATSLSDADIAAIAQSIVSDSKFAKILGAFSVGATGVLATGSTHSNKTLDSITGGIGAAIGSIQVGDLVLAADIPAGTFVVAVAGGGTGVTLSQAATGSNAGERVAIVRTGPPGLNRNNQLVVPGRGILRVLNGDVVAIDNTGWPILVSGAAIGYGGSQWNKV